MDGHDVYSVEDLVFQIRSSEVEETLYRIEGLLEDPVCRHTHQDCAVCRCIVGRRTVGYFLHCHSHPKVGGSTDRTDLLVGVDSVRGEVVEVCSGEVLIAALAKNWTLEVPVEQRPVCIN